MYYVYILKHPTEDHIYIGFSAELRSRIREHRTLTRQFPKLHPPFTLSTMCLTAS